MSENKCCGNCARFFNEDAKGNGFCSISPNRQVVTYRHNTCIAHEWKLPKWKEITPDNVDELKAIGKRVVVANKHHGSVFYRTLHDVNSLDSMARQGGYYYYVLPEIKLEKTK